MISKGEAIQRLKKMGVMVADDQSILTILLPAEISFSVGIKDVKEKLKAMDYDASFSIRQSKSSGAEKETDSVYPSGEMENTVEDELELEETVTEEELQGSLLSMDDDGQFSLGGFGLDF